MAGSGDDIAHVRKSEREIIMTEKGYDYQLQLFKGNFKSSLSAWRRHCSQSLSLITDCENSDSIRSHRDLLISSFESLTQAYHTLYDFQASSQPIAETELYERAEEEQQNFLQKIADRLRDFQSSRSERSLNLSSRSGRSNASRLSDAVARAAALKAELPFIDLEAKSKAELQKIQTLKQIQIAEAEASALSSIESQTAVLGASSDVQTRVSETNLVPLSLSSPSFTPSTKSPCSGPNEVKLQSSVGSSGGRPISSAIPETIQSSSSPRPVASVLNSAIPTSLNPIAQPFIPVTQSAVPASVSQIADPIAVTTPSVSPATASSEQILFGLAKSLVDQVNLSRLPSPEPGIFSGDPLAYPGWKSAFQTLIEQRQIPQEERIHYLKRYIGGSVREVIDGFFLMPSDLAYEKAKEALDERYGDAFVLANAFRDKLEKWPKISARDATGLRKFSDFLQQCDVAMTTIRNLAVLNDDRENRKLLVKLPEWLVPRWARVVSKHKETHKEFPPFKEFAKFISAEAKIACDPVTSLQSLKSQPEDRTYKPNASTGKAVHGRSLFANKPEPQGVVQSVSVRDSSASISKGPKIACPLCSGSHYLDDCKLFLSKSVSERKGLAVEKGLCFACLKGKHPSKYCKSRLQCKVCSKLHPTSLHGDLRSKRQDDKVAVSANQAPTLSKPTIEHQSTVGAAIGHGCNSQCSMVVPVYVSHESDPNNEILVYALLDTQSDTTFVLDSTCAQLDVAGVPTRLSLSTMFAENSVVSSSKVSGLIVRGFDGKETIHLPIAFTRHIIPANRSHIPTPEVAKKWPHLRHIADELVPLQNCEIGLLIGYNCARALTPREVVPADDNGPFAQKTDLGWGLVGITGDWEDTVGDAIGLSHRVCTMQIPEPLVSSCRDSADVPSVSFAFHTSVKAINSDDIVAFFQMDFSESTVLDSSLSIEDNRFIDFLSNGVHLENSHYSMPLPFRNERPSLPNNRQMALGRLWNLRKRLNSDRTLRSNYQAFMDNLLKNGHAERVPDAVQDNSNCWYIPHHGVYHPKKPGKLRVVFDCSAKFEDESLNSHLLQGPDLTNTLIGVLLRFRKEKVAFTCDIEQMFHQFFVDEADRDYLRFIWFSDENLTQPTDYRMCVHLFGAASSPGCANFGLKQVAHDNEAKYGAEAANFLRHDFYVDDGLKSVPSNDEAVRLISSCRSMCSEGGLRLHKFASNSKEVLELIPTQDRAASLTDVEIFSSNLQVERALGVQWCIVSDTLQFQITLCDKPLTRRGVLATVSSVYDPLGFIAPIILTGKQILQEMCRDKLDWDDPVPENLRAKWEKWRLDLPKLRHLQVKRCIKPDDFGKIRDIQLHHFSDASSTGYGQCSYIRLRDESGHVHCSLLMGKARVTPLKHITIPRLELTAALVSVNVSSVLQKELDFQDVTHCFWNDSKVVLGYIANESKRFHVFVANRVQQIKDQTKPSQWRYVDSENNPADIASRGATAAELMDSRWFDGPSFLWGNQLPTCDGTESDADLSNDPEVKKSKCFMSSAVSSQHASIHSRFENFSSWSRLVRAVAVCLRFKKLLKDRGINRKAMDSPKTTNQRQQTTVSDLQSAEIEILRHVQADCFGDELHKMSCGQSVAKNSALARLNPFVDQNGLIRVGGRLTNSSLDSDLKTPVILPRKSHVTNLILHHFHENVQHQGRGTTINEVRENGYWILGCSSAVSDLISQCVTCRKLRGQLQNQKMADLPTDRVDPAPPFTYCGVDFFGPFLVKEGRKEVKRYGCIFTCLTCRAIHIEVANSLDTDSFINALRRFVSIRGPIRSLRSDRGTNFVGAMRELREELNKMDTGRVSDFLLQKGCDFFEFRPNVPSASHMGGVWERQIRTVRNVLASMLSKLGCQLDDELLRTLMCEVTAIVNSRPLSVDNLNDPLSAEPLTPNHLLTMKSKVLLPPPGSFMSPDLYTRKRWRRIQYLANEFWNRWRKEYLNNLQTRSKWLSSTRNTQVGDIVLLKDDALHRNCWKIAMVTKADPDQDGLVRKVTIKTALRAFDNKGKAVVSITELERPVHKLVLLKEASN